MSSPLVSRHFAPEAWQGSPLSSFGYASPREAQVAVRQFFCQSGIWAGRARVRPSTRILPSHLALGVRCAAPPLSSAHSNIGYSTPRHRPSGRLIIRRVLVSPALVPPSSSPPPCLLGRVHHQLARVPDPPLLTGHRCPNIIRGEPALCFRGIRDGRDNALRRRDDAPPPPPRS